MGRVRARQDRSSDLARRIRLQVKHILMGRTTHKINKYDGLVRILLSSKCFRLKQFRQGKSTRTKSTNL